MHGWWNGLGRIYIFRKIPDGLGDVVSGKGQGGELEKDQRLIKRSGCRENCLVVGGSDTHVNHLAYHG